MKQWRNGAGAMALSAHGMANGARAWRRISISVALMAYQQLMASANRGMCWRHVSIWRKAVCIALSMA